MKENNLILGFVKERKNKNHKTEGKGERQSSKDIILEPLGRNCRWTSFTKDIVNPLTLSRFHVSRILSQDFHNNL